jgi:hypothetical protein
VESEPTTPPTPAPEAVVAGDATIATSAPTPTPAPAPAPKAKSKSRSKATTATETNPAAPATASAPAAGAVTQSDAGTIAATDAEAIPSAADASDATPSPVAGTDGTDDTPVAAAPEPEPEPEPTTTTSDIDTEAVPASAATPAPSPPAPGAIPEAVVPEPPEPIAAPSLQPPPRRAKGDKAVPSFVRIAEPAGSVDGRRKWRKPAAIAALALLLVLQLLLADRAQLASSARWRPLVSALCGALQCSLPAWREPAAFTLLHRDVRPHPTLPGVLHVSATFRNDARWPQPWPALLLTLSDVDGRNVGARAFAPREYLGDAPTHGGLASGQSATVAMDIIEPAPRIVAFTFDFH